MPTNEASDARPQSEQALLNLLIEVNRSRATSAGLNPSQYDAVTATIDAPGQWLTAFSAVGEEHLERARRAEEEGRIVAAASGWAGGDRSGAHRTDQPWRSNALGESAVHEVFEHRHAPGKFSYLRSGRKRGRGYTRNHSRSGKTSARREMAVCDRPSVWN